VPRTRMEIVRISQTTPPLNLMHLLRAAEKVEAAIQKQEDIILERRQGYTPFYFTFGFNQELEGCYAIVFAKDEADARNILMLVYEQLWKMIYASEKDAGVDEHQLKLVPFGKQNWRKG
jgi:hypothetical protein